MSQAATQPARFGSPSEHVHVQVPGKVGAVDGAREGEVGFLEPGEVGADELEVIVVGPKHPLPVRVVLSATSAPSLELGGELVVLPALVEDLGDARGVGVDGSAQELLGGQGDGETVGGLLGGIETESRALGGNGGDVVLGRGGAWYRAGLQEGDRVDGAVAIVEDGEEEQGDGRGSQAKGEDCRARPGASA